MQVNVSQLIDRSRVGGYQTFVILLCAMVAFLDGFDIQSMAMVVPTLTAEWGLPKSAFGPVLSASFAGIMLGTMGLGLLGDRLGRRKTLITSFIFVGVTSLATAFAQNVEQLMLARFLTGIGIGGCMPNATALTAEYVPAKRLSILVTVMFSAIPFGGVVGGFLAGDLIAHWGWSTVFIAGGVIPLVISLILLAALPESPKFLAMRPAASQRLGAILERIDPAYRYQPSHSFIVDHPQAKGALRELFSDGRGGLTAVLWLVFFFSLFGMYLLTSWLPSVFTDAGWSMGAAIKTVSLFQMGGIIGGLAAGYLVDRWGPYLVLSTMFLFAAVMTAAIGALGVPAWLTLVLVGFAGFGVVGAQLGMTALAASVYPTSARSTGVGWALGVGRLGAVISPTAGGIALSAHWSQPALFGGAAVPSAVCAVAVFMLWLAGRPSRAAARAPANP